MNSIAVIQARLGSTRYPGKVLEDCAGKTLLERVVDRVKCAKRLNGFVVAIPWGDERLLDFCQNKGWSVYPGAEQDVLCRYVCAAAYFETDPVVRVTADCPFLDPGVLNGMLDLYATGEYEMVTNNMERTFPLGLDAEVISLEALRTSDALMSEDDTGREHVTTYIREHPERFRIGNLRSSYALGHLRLTVDYPEDMALARALYLSGLGPAFSTADVIAALEAKPMMGWLHESALAVARRV